MIWLLNNLQKKYQIDKFIQAANKLAIEFLVIDPNHLQMLKDGDVIIIYYKQQIICKPAAIINWQGTRTGIREQHLRSAFDDVLWLDNGDGLDCFNDKFKWQLRTKLPTIKSLKLDSSQYSTSIELIENEFTYPFVLKSDNGSLGHGTYLINNRREYMQMTSLMQMLDEGFNIHIEQFFKYNNDVRMYIIGDNYHLLSRYNDNDFRANFSNGGTVQMLAKNKQFDNIYNAVRNQYQSIVLGVDILLNENQYIICEINSSPGFQGLEQVYDVDIASEILLAIRHKIIK